MDGKRHPSPRLSPKGRGVAILKRILEIFLSPPGERIKVRGLENRVGTLGTGHLKAFVYLVAPKNRPFAQEPSSILPPGYVILPAPSISPSRNWPLYLRPFGQLISPVPSGTSGAGASLIFQSPL